MYENSVFVNQKTYLVAKRKSASLTITAKALNEFLVSKETVVLRRWERSKQKFGFIKRVDKG